MGKKVGLCDKDDVPSVVYCSISEQVQFGSKAINIDMDNVKDSRERQFGMTVIS